MPFSVKDWKNEKAGGTPISAAALKDMEERLSAYTDGITAAADALVFKGVIDCSTNPNYPAADAGHVYRVSVAGKIGGASGTNVEIGDLLLCLTDGTAAGTQAAVGAQWSIGQTNIDGAVVGPASSTSGNIPTFNGASGKTLQDSGKAHSTDGSLASNSDAKIPTEKAVKTYVASAIAVKQDAATAATDEELAAHAADTTEVHGIADTTKLATKAEVEAKQDSGTAATDAELASARAALEERDLAHGGAVREEKPLAMFPNEHGWTGNGVGTFSDAGGEQIVNGDRSFKIETDGAGGTSIASSPALTAVDLTGKHVVFHSLLSFASRMKTVKLRLASGNIATDYAEVTVWNEEADTIPLQSTFERQSFPTAGFTVTGTVNWAAITKAQILVTDKGGAAKFTLYVAGIYAVPRRPQAVISFCFDDGYESVYTTALRRLSAYRFPASIYLIVDLIGSAGRLTLEQVKKFRDLYDWEIGGHAFTAANHNLASGLDSIATTPAMEAEFAGLKAWLEEIGGRRHTFAYPKGSAKMEKGRPYVIRDYGAGRSTGPGIETVPPRDNYTLRGNSIDGLTEGAAAVKAKIDQAIAQGGWLILTFHNLVAGAPAASTEFKSAEFNEIVDYIRTKQLEGKDVQVRTVRHAMDAFAPTGSSGPRIEEHTFAIPGEITVASGEGLRHWVRSAAGQNAKLVAVRARLGSGTKATVKLQKNGADATGFTGLEAKSTEDKQLEPEAPLSLTNNDAISLVVTAVEGTPKNLSVTFMVEKSR